MKYLFIAVSILFATASAGEDMSGYTETIFDEETFDLPHNPFSGYIEPYSFSEEKPHIEMINHLYGFDQPLENCFNSEKPSQSCFIPFPNSEQYCSEHKRLCDYKKADSKTPVAYISVKEGLGISIKTHLSNKSYSSYCLVLQKYNDDDDKTDFRHQKTINEKDPSYDIPYEWIKEGGIFKIYPHNSKIKNKTNDKKCNPQTTNKQAILAFKVLPYTEVTKNVVYVEINGDPNDNPWTPDTPNCTNEIKEGCCENGFTEACVKNVLKEIYNQAVIDVKATTESASKYLNNQLLNITMTKPEATQGNIYAKIKEKVDKIIADSEVAQKKDSQYWHIILAINKERKIWELSQCISEDSKILGISDITNCGRYGFRPERENVKTNYYVYNKINGGIAQKKDAEIRVKQQIENNKPKMHYYIYTNGKPHPYKPGDMLYTDNGNPVVPTLGGIKNSKLAFSVPLATNDKHDGYLAYGSLIFVPRRIGHSGLYALSHELGHSFGLTDVSVSEVYRTKENAIYKEQNEDDHGLFENDDRTKVGDREYDIKHASTESNLMSWQNPAGNKIRYRPVPIVCTGGTRYYKASKEISDSKGNKYKVYDSEKGVWGSNIERLILDGIENKDNLKEEDWLELNQWECIRGNCYDSKYSSTYSTNARKTYYNMMEEGAWCYANEKIEDGKNTRNRVTDEDTYKKDSLKIMSGKYIEKTGK